MKGYYKNHAAFETVKKFSIVPEFTIESSMMTATMKIKRDKVMEKYKDLIDSMYAGK